MTLVTRRALVLGGTGFLGSATCAELEGHGWQAVRASRSRGVDVTDPHALEQLVGQVQPHAILHLAGSPRDRGEVLARVHWLSVYHLLRIARGSRVVLVTSAAIYGSRPAGSPPLREGDAIRPATEYGLVKAAVHWLGQIAAQEVDVVEACPFNVIGPGMKDGLVLCDVAARLARGDRPVRLGAITPVRDFVDVRDVGRALRRILEDGRRGEVYHIASGIGRSVRDLVNALARAAGPFPWESTAPEVEDVSVGDPSKIRRELGWEPRIPFETSVAEAWRDLAHRLASR